jgi:sodium/potassium/calcium exchanger 6
MHKTMEIVNNFLDDICAYIFPDKVNSPILLFLALLVYTYFHTKFVFFIITKISIITKINTTFLGLTLICWGGCVGDLVTSVVAVKHNAGNLLITSIIGSQVINLQICLGLPWAIAIMKSYIMYNDTSFRLMFEATDIVNYLMPTFVLVIFSLLILTAFNVSLNKKSGYSLILAYCLYIIYEFKIR